MNEYKNPENADQLAIYNEQKTYFITMILSVFAIVANVAALEYNNYTHNKINYLFSKC